MVKYQIIKGFYFENVSVGIDKNEQVIVQRGKNKAYTLTAITNTDRFFADTEVKARILHSQEQANNGELTLVRKEDINDFLGL